MAVAALMVAVSVIIGVGIMIGSFRNTVVQWLDDVLQADIFISPPSLSSNQVTASMAPETAAASPPFPAWPKSPPRGVNVARVPARPGRAAPDPAGGVEPGHRR
ncbi:MAG: hypothetical protein R3A10_02885 [Caldilineaceae bacterium]